MRLGAILKELRDFDTALLANMIGYIDSTPAHEYYMGGYIRSLTPSLEPTVGLAFTCELDTSSPDAGLDEDGAKQFDKYDRQVDEMCKSKEPVVWVLKTVGSPDHECVAGDGLAKEKMTLNSSWPMSFREGPLRVKGLTRQAIAWIARL